MSFHVGDAIVHQVSTPGLGDHSYVVTVGTKAIVIDPQRDISRFETLLEGMTTVGVFETHIHNDYASGGPTLAESHGCEYVLPVGTRATVEHRAIAPGETVLFGSMTLQAIATPGHTPHHLAYALFSGDESVAVFTGGSMLVGAVGRCDLISPDLTDELVRAQYRSVNQLAADLQDPSLVVPTHGAGSFCSASAVSDTTSTIKLEKGRNPALTCPDENTFAAVQLAGYQLYPSYYTYMGPLNAAGAPPMPSADRPILSPMQLAALGTPALIDVRTAEEFADGHLVGSINVPFSNEVATYV
ncbi:MAG: MBL fold metallo-hydrolase, partial [Acidimicrobiia bacterium]|nr:MBL fold metallo-hydrolase [Acidimicrobiia bacterium]